QGRPPHPAPAPGGWETPPAMVTPVQFVVDPALKRLHIPAADGLEHDVGLALMEAGPLPRLWTAPMGARGAFLLTVDTEFMGDASLWLAEAGAVRSDPYSYFLMDTAFTARGRARLDSLRVDQGFHWDRTVSSWQPVRLLRLRLYRRQRSAEEQLRGL